MSDVQHPDESASTRRPSRRAVHALSAALRRKGVVTIPLPIREELDLHEGDNLLVTIEDGKIVLIPAALIPRDQAWFWTPEWQAREREADADLAADRTRSFEDEDDFLRAVREA